jgi:hypothetical protein
MNDPDDDRRRGSQEMDHNGAPLHFDRGTGGEIDIPNHDAGDEQRRNQQRLCPVDKFLTGIASRYQVGPGLRRLAEV